MVSDASLSAALSTGSIPGINGDAAGFGSPVWPAEDPSDVVFLENSQELELGGEAVVDGGTFNDDSHPIMSGLSADGRHVAAELEVPLQDSAAPPVPGRPVMDGAPQHEVFGLGMVAANEELRGCSVSGGLGHVVNMDVIQVSLANSNASIPLEDVGAEDEVTGLEDEEDAASQEAEAKAGFGQDNGIEDLEVEYGEENEEEEEEGEDDEEDNQDVGREEVVGPVG